jgi:hypothetical protein
MASLWTQLFFAPSVCSTTMSPATLPIDYDHCESISHISPVHQLHNITKIRKEINFPSNKITKESEKNHINKILSSISKN